MQHRVAAPVAVWLTLTCFPSQPDGEFIVFRQPKYPQICFLFYYNEAGFVSSC